MFIAEFGGEITSATSSIRKTNFLTISKIPEDQKLISGKKKARQTAAANAATTEAAAAATFWVASAATEAAVTTATTASWMMKETEIGGRTKLGLW